MLGRFIKHQLLTIGERTNMVSESMIHIFLDSLIMLGIIVLPIMFYLAHRKITKGDLSDIVKWLFYLSIPLFLYKATEEVSEWMSLSGEIAEFVEWTEFTFFFILILVMVRIALLVYKFADKYGFADGSKTEKYFAGKR